MTKKTALSKLVRRGALVNNSAPDSTWPIPDQYVGLEIEIEDYSQEELDRHGDRGSPYWSVHGDGSLRNGVEYVLSQPMMGNDLLKAIDYFFTNIKTYSDSPRTSIHVHLNMLQEEESVEGLRNMVALYYMFEDAFFSVADEGRKWNGYCNAFDDNPPAFLEELMAHESSGDMGKLYESLLTTADQNTNRYYGLNLAALRRYGTIEFRHMPLVRDKTRLMEWIGLIMETKDAANRLAADGMTPANLFLSADDLVKLPDLMPRYGRTLLQRTDATRAYLRLCNLHGLALPRARLGAGVLSKNKAWVNYVQAQGLSPSKYGAQTARQLSLTDVARELTGVPIEGATVWFNDAPLGPRPLRPARQLAPRNRRPPADPFADIPDEQEDL